MIPQNLKTINKSFETQSQKFERDIYDFTNKKYLNDIISKTIPSASDTVLEVAAGTCALGRAFAPIVKSVTCIDATKAMLDVGRQAAKENNLDNIVFIRGYAEDLPFQNNSFDIVVSRLSFHHFTDVNIPFREMVRVLKPTGKLVFVDMEVLDNNLRTIQNEIEYMRDNSHTKTLTKSEMKKLFTDNQLELNVCDNITLPKKLDDWLDLTKTPEQTKVKIINLMKDEIKGGSLTGFNPYIKENTIYFNQIWAILIGTFTKYNV